MDVGSIKGRIKLDNTQFKKSIAEATKGFSAVERKAISLNQATQFLRTAYEGLAKATKTAFAQMERGARRIDIEATFKNLAKGAGRQAAEMLKQLKDATRGALTEMEAMAAANQALISGMDFDQVVVAMQYLQKYAKAANKDFGQLANTIMTGLARGSTLMLDDAAIVLDQTTLIAAKTKEYGRALTEVEKKSVLVNAAVEQMRQKMPALGGNIRTTADDLMSFKAALADYQDSIAKWNVRFYGFARASVEGWKVAIINTKIQLQKLKAVYAKYFGDITIIVSKAMMKVLATARNAYNHILAALTDYNGFFATAAKTGLKVMVAALDTGLIALFEANQSLINAEGDTNAELKRLYEQRAAIVEGGQKWINLAKGKFATDSTVPNLNFGGTSKGGSLSPDEAVKSLQRQIDQLNFGKSIIGLDQYNRALKEANFAADQLKKTYGAFGDNQQINGMIEQVRTLKVETVNMTQAFEESQKKIRLIGDVLGDTLRNFTQPLANSLRELAQTGKVSIKELASSLVETLQVYAAEKTAHFMMEGTYRTIMAFVDKTRRQDWLQEAAAAWKGAGIMGSFVAGSGLAGMAHSGMTSIPENGTWLLKKNERVVDSRTNEDLKAFLKGSSGKGRPVNMTVHINNSDEQGVMKALPHFKQAVIDIINTDISTAGSTYQTIKTYTR